MSLGVVRTCASLSCVACVRIRFLTHFAPGNHVPGQRRHACLGGAVIVDVHEPHGASGCICMQAGFPAVIFKNVVDHISRSFRGTVGQDRRNDQRRRSERNYSDLFGTSSSRPGAVSIGEVHRTHRTPRAPLKLKHNTFKNPS